MASITNVTSEKKNSESPAIHTEYFDSEKREVQVDVAESLEQDPGQKYVKPPDTARDLVAEILMLEDDPAVNPWTFRMWFIGIGMSIFAG
jgi:hypothetical protein